MENRFAGLFPFERAAALFFYRSGSEISELMQDLKYRHYKGLARYMGRIMGEELLLSDFLRDINVIVPVPMHFIKKSKRGYNQTEELALGMSEETGIPIKLALKAIRPHKSQTTLNLGQRRENLKNVFSIRPKHHLDGKHILLLDDVCTTGTTLTEAAETILKSNSHTKISLLTLGVTF
ncbi:MAG: ComF family protein [Muribaculaceae bacterium]|nr:ComF family protein [Muribaculaceae bacterium]